MQAVQGAVEDRDDGGWSGTAAASRPPTTTLANGGNGTVPLLVNMAGCGLDAVRYSCTRFYNDYMGPGLEFECNVADVAAGPWTRVAVPVAVGASSGAAAWMGGLVPLALCVACILYIRARRLFTVEPAVATRSKRASTRPRGSLPSAPRSFYKRKMLEMDEWRRRRRQLVLTGASRGSTASRLHGEGDSDGLVTSDAQDDEDDLEDVVVDPACMGRADDDDDGDVVMEARLPPTPPESPEPPPPPWPRFAPPPPPPCSPETTPPPTPHLVPLIVYAAESPPRGLRAIPVEPKPAPRPRAMSASSSSPSGSASWRAAQQAQRNIRTVSATVHAHQNYDISQ